jgi:hypothetical protein
MDGDPSGYLGLIILLHDQDRAGNTRELLRLYTGIASNLSSTWKIH